MDRSGLLDASAEQVSCRRSCSRATGTRCRLSGWRACSGTP